MPVLVKSGPTTGKPEMTKEEFKRWFLQAYDADKDGNISRKELAEAIRAAGCWFSGRKAKHGVRFADENSNGRIDNSELDKLASSGCIEKFLGIRIVERKE